MARRGAAGANSILPVRGDGCASIGGGWGEQWARHRWRAVVSRFDRPRGGCGDDDGADGAVRRYFARAHGGGALRERECEFRVRGGAISGYDDCQVGVRVDDAADVGDRDAATAGGALLLAHVERVGAGAKPSAVHDVRSRSARDKCARQGDA